jgi:hypothetical protein
MITLVILPIIGIWKINCELRKRAEYCIQLDVLNSKVIKNYKDYYSLTIPPKRNYIKIEMSGIRSEDSSKFHLIRNFGRGIDKSKDTTIGLQIIFSNKVKYSTYVSAINELLIAKVQTYAPLEDTIFVFYINRTDSCRTSNIPDNWSCLDFYYFVDDNRTLEEIRQAKINHLKSVYKIYIHYWPIYLIIILLILINVIKFRKIYLKRN